MDEHINDLTDTSKLSRFIFTTDFTFEWMGKNLKYCELGISKMTHEEIIRLRGYIFDTSINNPEVYRDTFLSTIDIYGSWNIKNIWDIALPPKNLDDLDINRFRIRRCDNIVVFRVSEGALFSNYLALGAYDLTEERYKKLNKDIWIIRVKEKKGRTE